MLEAVRLLKLFICMVKHTWTMQRIALTSGEQLYTEEYLTGEKKIAFIWEKYFGFSIFVSIILGWLEDFQFVEFFHG